MRANWAKWSCFRVPRAALALLAIGMFAAIAATGCGANGTEGSAGQREVAGEDGLPAPLVAAETTIAPSTTDATLPEPLVVDGGFDGDSFARSLVAPSGALITSTFPTHPRGLPLEALQDGTGRVLTTYTLTTDLELGVYLSILVGTDASSTCDSLMASRVAVGAAAEFTDGAVTEFSRTRRPTRFHGSGLVCGG